MSLNVLEPNTQAIIEGSVDAVLVPAMFPGPRVTRASFLW